MDPMFKQVSWLASSFLHQRLSIERELLGVLVSVGKYFGQSLKIHNPAYCLMKSEQSLSLSC